MTFFCIFKTQGEPHRGNYCNQPSKHIQSSLYTKGFPELFDFRTETGETEKLRFAIFYLIKKC